MKGWLHWRLLGALTKGDARAAYSRSVVAPSSSLRPLSFSPCGPGSSLQCSGNRIPSNHSIRITRQPPSLRRSTASSPPPCNGRAVLRKEKWVWRLETCDGAFDFAPTHSAAGPRLDQLQTLEATLRPTLVLPLQPVTVLPATSVVARCCH